MSRYTSATDADRKAMLESIGAGSVDDLFADIPEAVRLDRAIDLPPGKPEQEVYAYLRDLAARNVSAEDEICFLGAGMYDHYVPSLVDALLGRSEFLTPYTPYQPEVSQGTLQVMFEYQTAISELTGLPVSNATLYEGPSAVASAGWMARLQNGRGRFLVSRALHPHAREALTTTAPPYGTSVEELPLSGGVTDAGALREAIGDDVSAVFLAQPNFLGAVEDLEELAPIARETGALLVVVGRPDDARACCARPATSTSTSRWGRASRSATGSTTAARRSASSRRGRSTCGGCRAGSPARPSTPTASAASCSPCRRASSTSGARRPRTTSRRRRR